MLILHCKRLIMYLHLLWYTGMCLHLLMKQTVIYTPTYVHTLYMHVYIHAHGCWNASVPTYKYVFSQVNAYVRTSYMPTYVCRVAYIHTYVSTHNSRRPYPTHCTCIHPSYFSVWQIRWVSPRIKVRHLDLQWRGFQFTPSDVQGVEKKK